MLAATDDDVRTLMIETLHRKLKEMGRSALVVDEHTKLLELEVIDSQGLLDVILEVEDRCGRQFDPERIDLETDITLATMARAFGVQS